LTGLPVFALGLGLSIRPSVTTGGGTPAPSAGIDGTFHPSLDLTQRIGANILSSATVNTVALSLGRSIRVQRQPDRRAARGAVRDRRRRRD
jgi:hypothetical protein